MSRSCVRVADPLLLLLLLPPLLLAGVGPVAAQPASPDFPVPAARFEDAERTAKLATAFSEIDRLFRDFVDARRIPGAAWGIVVDGKLVHAGATGVRELKSRTPVSPETVFRIASMTKSFTAMAVLRLRDEGRLALDDPAERYVPELKDLAYPTADAPRITIRHLLTHGQGFPEDNPWGDRQLARSDAWMNEMIRTGIPFSTSPGTAYEYSNYGYALLGRIVANVAGMPYEDYVRSAILRPLGMHSTTFEPAAVLAERLAHGYRIEDGAWREEPLLAHGSFGAMGGMLTSVADLSRYVGLLLDAWPSRDAPDDGPVRRASLREMQQVARFSGAAVSRDGGRLQLSAAGYGFGLGVQQSCRFRQVVGHGGGLPGFGSLMRWLPEYGVGILTLSNLTYAGWSSPVNSAFEALAATGGLVPRVPQPSPALVEARQAVTRLVLGWDDGLADEMAADNLFLDRPKAERRREVGELLEQLGSCRPGTDFDVENALRGRWTLPCERGALQVSITLAPVNPPKVQQLAVQPAGPTGLARPPTCPD